MAIRMPLVRFSEETRRLFAQRKGSGVGFYLIVRFARRLVHPTYDLTQPVDGPGLAPEGSFTPIIQTLRTLPQSDALGPPGKNFGPYAGTETRGGTGTDGGQAKQRGVSGPTSHA